MTVFIGDLYPGSLPSPTFIFLPSSTGNGAAPGPTFVSHTFPRALEKIYRNPLKPLFGVLLLTNPHNGKFTRVTLGGATVGTVWSELLQRKVAYVNTTLVTCRESETKFYPFRCVKFLNYLQFFDCLQHVYLDIKDNVKALCLGHLVTATFGMIQGGMVYPGTAMESCGRGTPVSASPYLCSLWPFSKYSHGRGSQYGRSALLPYHGGRPRRYVPGVIQGCLMSLLISLSIETPREGIIVGCYYCAISMWLFL